jgi:nitrite reductase/ring-hydroxylating ferredoxin subunit
MTEPAWVFAIDESKLGENSPRVVFPMGIPILLVKISGETYAISNKCAPMACPLVEGTLEGYTITCLCHDWRFDVRTGEFLDAKEIKIPKYELKRSDGRIFVKI